MRSYKIGFLCRDFFAEVGVYEMKTHCCINIAIDSV